MHFRLHSRRSALGRGWISPTVRGTVGERGGDLQERSPPECTSDIENFFFLDNILGRLAATIEIEKLWKLWKRVNIGFLCKPRALPSGHPQSFKKDWPKLFWLLTPAGFLDISKIHNKRCEAKLHAKLLLRTLPYLSLTDKYNMV